MDCPLLNRCTAPHYLPGCHGSGEECDILKTHNTYLDEAKETGVPYVGSNECSIANVDDLAMLVRRMARQLRKYNPDSLLATKAVDYLNRCDIKSSPLKQ